MKKNIFFELNEFQVDISKQTKKQFFCFALYQVIHLTFTKNKK